MYDIFPNCTIRHSVNRFLLLFLYIQAGNPRQIHLFLVTHLMYIIKQDRYISFPTLECKINYHH